MSAYPKILATEREVWLLNYHGRIMSEYECKMWDIINGATKATETIVEVYILKERNEYGETKFKHEFKGYALVNTDNYPIITDEMFMS